MAGLDGKSFADVEFVNSNLDGAIFEGCRFVRVRFVRVTMRSIRMWNTTFEHCTFEGVSMKEGAIGGVVGRRRNQFVGCQFRDVDFTRVGSLAAVFVNCSFEQCKIKRVDFQSTTFTDCRFAGVVEDVLFYSRGFSEKRFPPNEMSNVDFADAELRRVEFRGLDLETVRFPHGEHSLLVREPKRVLPEFVLSLKSRSDDAAISAKVFFGDVIRWLGPKQAITYFDMRDLDKMFGEGAAREFAQQLIR